MMINRAPAVDACCAVASPMPEVPPSTTTVWPARSSRAGAALIPESAVFLVVSPLVGGLVARVGVRWPMAVGILLVAGGFAALS
ncbi:MAG TPA: hypothetical protein VHC23_09065, partial [Jatrophihabitans sp.]|nr:hypothetical protein [Jatrophihabitans sp.]